MAFCLIVKCDPSGVDSDSIIYDYSRNICAKSMKHLRISRKSSIFADGRAFCAPMRI